MKKYMYYDEIGTKASNFLSKDFGTDKSGGASTITAKTASFRQPPFAIPFVPAKVSGSYTATISNKDGSTTNQLSATAKLWDRLTGTVVLSNPKGRYGVTTSLGAQGIPFLPGLQVACSAFPWSTAYATTKFHHNAVGVVSMVKKNAGKPELASAMLLQLPRDLYFGVNLGFSLLKPKSKILDDVSSDDDDNTSDDGAAGSGSGSGSEDDTVVVVTPKKRCASCFAAAKKSVTRLDGYVAYATPKMEVKAYLTGFGSTLGCSLFRQLSGAWSMAANACLNVNRHKIRDNLFVEVAAKYLTKRGDAVKVKATSDAVVKASYSAKISDYVSALFYGSLNKELNNNVGFSLVFSK